MEFSVICPILLICVTVVMSFTFDSKLAIARKELFERDEKITELESKLLELEETIEAINSGS
ncbi:hypothetical protein K9N68_39305 (plasmid) [Kovacikia minuta CCNUW1]|uniref:hypothetical protein n=1 Tax=Kovacikia minuta TaxID=2931930 RepID=UPI001CC9FAD1|nr:hypothetical protein [Kovacikia minuta]UBF30109.1 hypothetical protein K9N68_38685 [Kovacikia minuta CCNUW1]UBF30186.1 hypothetical protein K9N68_39305 [Kovacikia minuta CCNUW1]